MPSVGTQTVWSWLQETRESQASPVEGLVAEARASHGSSRADEGPEQTVGGINGESASTHSTGDQVQPPSEGEMKASPQPSEDVSVQPQSPAGKVEDPLHSTEEEDTVGSDVDCNRSPAGEEDCSASTPVSSSLPQELIRQLEEIQFPSDSELSSEEEERQDETEEGEASVQPEPPSLSSAQLPLPAILQYLRESESMASHYFSLANMEEVAERRPGASTGHGTGKTGDRVQPVGTLLPQGGTLCEFCGQRTTLLRNLWTYTEEGTNKDSPFCCAEYQEFCLLAAAYLRQAVQRKLLQNPRKIAIDPRKRRSFRKTMQERALAMMRRKKKWEELRKKKLHQLQSSSFYSLTKQTKTIQFSLLSPTAAQTRWMVRPESSAQGSNTHLLWGRKRRRREERGRRELHKTRGELEAQGDRGLLPSELMERLQKHSSPPGNLDVREYASGQPFVTVLPDRTGHCYYMSGRLALVVFTPYPGVLSYLVFEDRDHPQMLASMSELGKVCCYNPDGSMRLLLTTSQGTLYDDRGQVKTTWSWKSHAHSPMFQPLSLSLNKYFQLRCSAQDNITLTFSVPPHFVKFNIGCKLSKDLLETLKSPEEKRVHKLQSHLRETQSTISHLMQAIQYTKKLSQLQSVYAPHGTMHTRTGNHGNRHKRTRSTGALPLQGQHRPNTLRPLV